MTDTALLIIDVQNDFCPGGALAVADGSAIVPLINRLQSKFPLKVMTQDWHPADHTSFADNHSDAQPFSMIEMPYGSQVLWPSHCVQGSQGADFHSDLETDNVALIVRKGFRKEIDSYSAFFENDRTTPTGLTGYLREQGMTSLVMVGLATDFCVRFSAVDAAKLGFDVSVVSDACRAIDMDGSLGDAMRDFKENDVKITTSDAFL